MNFPIESNHKYKEVFSYSFMIKLVHLVCRWRTLWLSNIIILGPTFSFNHHIMMCQIPGNELNCCIRLIPGMVFATLPGTPLNSRPLICTVDITLPAAFVDSLKWSVPNRLIGVSKFWIIGGVFMSVGNRHKKRTISNVRPQTRLVLYSGSRTTRRVIGYCLYQGRKGQFSKRFGKISAFQYV